ncbi:hypothetical protein Tco_0788479, partial [Tanacetum coccineum]
MQASDGGFVRKSAASMLGGKKPVTAAVSFIYNPSLYNGGKKPVTAAPASKKAGPVKTSAGKKASGPSQNKQVA